MEIRINSDLQLALNDLLDSNRELRRRYEERMGRLDQHSQQREHDSSTLLVMQHQSIRAKWFLNRLIELFHSVILAVQSLQQVSHTLAEFEGIMQTLNSTGKKILEVLGSLSGLHNLLYPNAGPNASAAANKIVQVSRSLRQVLNQAQASYPCIDGMVQCFTEVESQLAGFFAVGQQRTRPQSLPPK